MARKLEVTVWEGPKRCEFYPFDGWTARWTLLVPEPPGRFVSDSSLGPRLVYPPYGQSCSAWEVLCIAREGDAGFAVLDGYEDAPPDARLVAAPAPRRPEAN
jgi:hypothetical protein